MNQKELVKLTREYRLSINPKMSKGGILTFINEALDGNNDKWLPLALEYKERVKGKVREQKLKSLGI